MLKHLEINIHGEVQGVNFRYYVMREAERLNLTGFVRNMPDGSVAVTAEGEETALQKLLEWCQRGPSYAHVGTVTNRWVSDLKNFFDFKIVR